MNEFRIGKKEERKFVDRKKCIELFENALSDIREKECHVLVYYGVAGVGKTSLIRNLPNFIDEYSPNYQHEGVEWASIDLDLKKHIDKITFLILLTNELHGKYGINFHFFDIAHATYSKMVNPGERLEKENYLIFSEAGFEDLYSVFNNCSYIPSLPSALGMYAIKKATGIFRDWYNGKEKEIRDLSTMSAAEIEEQLHLYWAKDLWEHLQKTSKAAVIFIDTYEILMKQQNSSILHSEDKWIRELVRILPDTLWVISGKNKLLWEKAKPEFNGLLDQNEIKEFSEDYALEFLENCKIEDSEIQKRIIESSGRLPLYLNVSVDTYWNLINEGKKPSKDDFAEIPFEIYKKFLDSVREEEQNTILKLSVPNFWDYNLFKALVKEFNLNYEIDDFQKLCNYSFVNYEATDLWSMHQLMRKSFIEHQDKKKIRETHKFLFEYYDNKLKDVESNKITEEHKIALSEAFYYGKIFLKTEDLFNWFIKESHPFYEASLWSFLLPLYNEILQLTKKELGPQHPIFSHILHNLGTLLSDMGRIEEAKQRYEAALEIYKTLLSNDLDNVGYQSYVGTTLNNLGTLLSDMGRIEEAKQRYEAALQIYNTLLSNDPDNVRYKSYVGMTLNNLGTLLLKMGKYDDALKSYERALDVIETGMGADHPYFGKIMENIIRLYGKMGREYRN